MTGYKLLQVIECRTKIETSSLVKFHEQLAQKLHDIFLKQLEPDRQRALPIYILSPIRPCVYIRGSRYAQLIEIG